jgi:hypothetical protein
MTRNYPRFNITRTPLHAETERSGGTDIPTLVSPRSRGVVMVIALLAIVLIASLLFYVINVGTSVQGRVVTQHAADAVAIGGASQVARSMNTVAMNNVETARLIVAISVLDGLPLAVDMSITDATEEQLGDVDALAQAASAQIGVGVVDAWFAAKLREMMDSSDSESVVSEQRYLRELDDLFSNQPDMIPEMTWYEAPSNEMGKMHQAMRSMDANSQAAMQTLGETAQSAATRSAQANLGNNDLNNAGLLLPAAPSVPWERGVFEDFERPIRKGLLPGSDDDMVVDTASKGFGQIDDALTNRGPWDAVFGWRYTDGQLAEPGAMSGDRGAPPQVGRSRPARDPEEYYVYGPEHVLLRAIERRQFSRLRSHLWDLYSIKANYLWTGTTQRTVLDPAWEIDIGHDDERSSDRNSDHAYGLTSSDIRETAFIVCEIKSRLSDEQGHPGRQGLTWNYVEEGYRQSPYVLYRGGWTDPRNGSPVTLRGVKGTPTWRKLQNYVWRLSAVYETDPLSPGLGGDMSIGLPPIRTGTDADGNATYAAQEVHWEIDFMLVGVNVGTDVEVNNPWEGFDRNDEDAPAPIDFVHEQFPPNDNYTRNQYLTFLGVARQSSRPGFWPTRFNRGRAYPYNTAIAQAYVFNNHSWDMWTQTWQAQLEPVTNFDDWVNKAGAAVSAAQTAPGLDPVEISEMAEYLRSVQALAPVMLNH